MPKKKKMSQRDIYEKWESSPRRLRERSSRNKARRIAIKAGLIKPRSKLEIDHKDGDPNNNAVSNLRAVSRKINRTKDNNTGHKKKR